MATVYLGRDEVLDRPVAVKVLKGGFDEDIAERFQREGRTAARLSHPNIVGVYDAGEAELDGREAPYIVMEPVPGGDLKSLIDSEGRLPSERVARLGAGVASGLSHAHERGVIHRDIKPHNILLDESGEPKLTDFGIARALDVTAMTVSGVYLGTALYSSPEQLKGEGTTPKSDIYSLGAALYQAASGGPPFSGTSLEVANQHTLREPEAPGARRASGDPDPELDALILSCLAKNPEDRPSATEVRERLSSAAAEPRPEKTGEAAAGPPGGFPGRGAGRANSASQSHRVRRRRPVLRTFAGAAALVLLLVAGAALALMNGGPQSSPGDSGGEQAREVPGEQAPDSASSGSQQSASSDSAANDGAPEASAPSEDSETPVAATGEEDGGSGGSAARPERGAPAGEEAAARTVRSVYQLAAAEDYDGSYGLLSSGFKQREAGSQQVWAGTFSTLESISFVEGPTASVSGDTARVTGTTRAVHTDRTEFNRGTWTLVRENGEWRLDELSVQKL